MGLWFKGIILLRKNSEPWANLYEPLSPGEEQNYIDICAYAISLSVTTNCVAE
jgi:hypothetical protein